MQPHYLTSKFIYLAITATTHTQLNYLLGVGASDLPKSIIPNSSADPGSRAGTRLQRGFNVTRQPRPTRLRGPHINFLRIVQVSFIRWFKSISSLFFPEIEWTHSLLGYSWLTRPKGLQTLKYLERDPEDLSLWTSWFKPFQCNKSWSHAAPQTYITIWLHLAAQTTLYFQHTCGRGLYLIHLLYKATHRQR